MSDDRRLDIENAAIAEQAARIKDSKFIRYFLDMGKDIEEADLREYGISPEEANNLNQILGHIRQTEGIQKETLGDSIMQGLQGSGRAAQRREEDGQELIEVQPQGRGFK